MMSDARFKVIYQGLTSAAKKVYEAIPINDMWTTSQIVTEITRSGSSMDYHIAAGCINSLIGAGLVCEPKRAHFIRTSIRIKATTAPRTAKEQADQFVAETIAKVLPEPATPAPTEKTMPTTDAKKQTPIDILSALSARALRISDDMKRLAVDIDNGALQIEDQMQADAQALQKLKQLQTLLQSLNTPA
jgi:hypothetical protein